MPVRGGSASAARAGAALRGPRAARSEVRMRLNTRTAVVSDTEQETG